MIPRAFIMEWQHTAPWPGDEQIEQDLILSRILVELYQNDFLKEQLIFRGGTALNKLYFPSPVRYSEDLDFVQITAGPIKKIVKTIQSIVDPWLGKSSTDPRKDGFRIYYQFAPESDPEGLKRIKIEINTREHFSVLPIRAITFSVKSQWFTGNCTLKTYNINELLATKMRALYQRKKGRDLFDLDWAVRHNEVNFQDITAAFKAYMDHQGNTVTQKQYIQNIQRKLKDYVFLHDIDNFIRADIRYDPVRAYENIEGLIQMI